MSHDSTSPSLDETRPLLSSGATPTPRRDDGLLTAADSSLAVAREDDCPRVTSASLRIGATMLCFIVLGMFNAPIGVVLPPLKEYYHLDDLRLSLIFLAPPVGYVLASQFNRHIHLEFGQRGIAFIGPLFHLLYAVVASCHPPFPLLLAAVAAGQVGTGVLDASWCTLAAAQEKANTVSGLLHGSYSAGAAIGPFFASTLVYAARKPWYSWYYVMGAVSLVEMAVLVFAFRHEDAARYRQDKQQLSNDDGFLAHARELLTRRATWFSAIYLLTYVGTELAVSDWLVVFLIRIRGTTPYQASMCLTAFWIGMAIGRLVLGYPTDRIGVRRATAAYLVIALALQALFIIIKVNTATVILMALLGFFCGPLFPSCIVCMNQLLPRELHVSAVSFVASAGQIGGAVLPFVLGALANSVGIKVYQIMVSAQLTGALAIWGFFPRLPSTLDSFSREDDEPTVTT